MTMAGNAENLLDHAQREAQFFDGVYADADRRFKAKQYMVPPELIRQVVNPGSRPLIDREYACTLIGALPGKNVLDYGAGDGWNSICLAKGNAKVWAIDISEVGVELIKKMAVANEVGELVTAEVRDCHNTGFEGDMFDVIYGGGVIHHLDVAKAGRELSRVLRPDGVAVFIEPIRESNITDYIKAVVLFVLRRKPEEVTDDEEVLNKKKIDLLKESFRVVRCKQFIVASSASALVSSPTLHKFLLWVDYVLMKYIPGFERLGRSVVIELRQPIKENG